MITKYVYFIKITKRNETKLDYKLPNYTRHNLQLSNCDVSEINSYFNNPYPKINSNIKHIIAFNEIIIGDWGIDLMPKWWDYRLSKKIY